MATGFGAGFAQGLNSGVNAGTNITDSITKRQALRQQQIDSSIENMAGLIDQNLATVSKIVADSAQPGKEVDGIKDSYLKSLTEAADQLAVLGPKGEQIANMYKQRVASVIGGLKTKSEAFRDTKLAEIQGSVQARNAALGNNQQALEQTGPQIPVADQQQPQTQTFQATPEGSMPPIQVSQAAPQQVAQPMPGTEVPPQYDEYGIAAEAPSATAPQMVNIGGEMVSRDVAERIVNEKLGMGANEFAEKLKLKTYEKQINDINESMGGYKQAISVATRMKEIAQAGIFTGPSAWKDEQIAKGKALLGQASEEDLRKISNMEQYRAGAINLAAARLKAFGSGSAVSDRDVEYALLQVGGKEGLLPETIEILTTNLIFDSKKAMSDANSQLKRMGVTEFMEKIPGGFDPTSNKNQTRPGILSAKVIQEARDIRNNASMTDEDKEKALIALAEREVTDKQTKAANSHFGTDKEPKQPGSSAQAAPKAGTVEDGYRFKGGDPSDPNSWEKVN